MTPRYHGGQWVEIAPAGLIFGGERYRAQIVTSAQWDDTFGAWYYRMDVELPTERLESLIFETEIVGPANEIPLKM